MSLSLRSAFDQRALRNYRLAKTILEEMFSNQPNSIEALQAGVAMLFLFRDTSDNQLFDFAQNGWQRYRRLDPAFGLIIAKMLAMQGRNTECVERLSDVITLGRNTPHEKAAWLDLFHLYVESSQFDLASHILDTLEAKYGRNDEAASASWLLKMCTGSPTRPLGRLASQEAAEKPSRFSLSQNYPNPFNPSTTIGYELPIDSRVTMKIYDLLGREIAILINDWSTAGYHQVVVDASELSTGVYFYQLEAAGLTATKKLLILK